MDKITAIEITFTQPVELTRENKEKIIAIADEICNQYEKDHPTRTMWPSGIGQKPTYIPMTQEEEMTRGMEFDESVFSVECFERENYEFKCLKCGLPQGDHGHCITNPPAGACEFVSTQ